MSLENWNNPIPWRDERHIQISVATDASSSGWGATIVSPNRRELFDYWTQEEFTWDIAPKEPMAIDKMLSSWSDEVRNANAMKVLFSTTVALNVLLHLLYVRSADNLTDGPSRHRS